ncbi:MAG TPA: PilZ domain-containing protein [Terriglobales bacterium]|nr:PilZ domain-containing protein [Terriglobales bacterium]
MSRRKSQRHFIALPALIFGNDSEGKGFRDPVCTLDVSASGARISNFHRKVNIGQELTLDLKKHKVRFRVAWVGQDGGKRAGQLGLQAIDPLNRIADLESLLSGTYVDTFKLSLADAAKASS